MMAIAYVAFYLTLSLCLSNAAKLHNPLEAIDITKCKFHADSKIQMEVSSTVLEKSGEWLEVRWSGVESPSYNDWVALMVPAGADSQQTTPAKYKMAASRPSHIISGNGNLKFHLINYRQDMEFLFMRGGLSSPIAVARSPTIRVANPNEAAQGHLALTGKDGEMLLQWTSHNASQPEVRWGEKAEDLSSRTPATSFRYEKEDMCGAPASTVGWTDAGTQHMATLTGLKPAHRYFYSYGDPAWGFSTVASFVSAPVTSPDTHVALLAVADMGQAELDSSFDSSEMLASLDTTGRLTQEVQSGKYGLLVHNGDISYARGYSSSWDNFFHQLAPIAGSIPYMVTVGNHERDWPGTGDRFNFALDSGGECGVSYEKRITMPLSGRDKQWYSFDYGPIHFLQYSTEHHFAPGTPQYDFIVQDLEKVDRTRTPWLIVGGHRPIYISSTNYMGTDGDQEVAADLREALEPLLVKFKVDMTWHGHHHSYQRTCPMINGSCVPLNDDGSAAAPVHLVIGNGGAMLSPNLAEPAPSWLVRSMLWWGYARVEASGTRMRVEMVADFTGHVADTVELVKPRNWGAAFMQSRKKAE